MSSRGNSVTTILPGAPWFLPEVSVAPPSMVYNPFRSLVCSHTPLFNLEYSDEWLINNSLEQGTTNHRLSELIKLVALCSSFINVLLIEKDRLSELIKVSERVSHSSLYQPNEKNPLLEGRNKGGSSKKNQEISEGAKRKGSSRGWLSSFPSCLRPASVRLWTWEVASHPAQCVLFTFQIKYSIFFENTKIILTVHLWKNPPPLCRHLPVLGIRTSVIE